MNMRIIVFTFLLLRVFSTSAEDKLPELIGDGVVDDTKAIQALLDTRAKTVYLPEPRVCYLISKALVIHSDQTLKLDPNTVISLADNAMDYLLINSDRENGNRNICIIGGIWDGNNLHQTCPYHQGDRSEGGLKKYMGNVIFLMNVENLYLEGLTIKDPETFGVHLAKVRKFTVKDIVFDYNLELVNEDGIHIKGPSSEGFIRNIKGNTNDDMVALNADDQPMFEPSRGPITDICIDGLYAENGYTAVRLLSGGSPVKRVHISNIYGSFRTNVISLTHHRVHPDEPRLFEDISINNIYVARQRDTLPNPQPNWIMQYRGGNHEKDKYTAEELAANPYMWWENARVSNPFLWIQYGVTVENLTVSNLARHEWLEGTQPTFTIEKDAIVRNLKLRDIEHQNHTDKPLPFILNDGTIEHLFINAVVIRDKNGKEKIQALIGEGNVGKKHGDFIFEE
jgi:polygalacturonase